MFNNSIVAISSAYKIAKIIEEKVYKLITGTLSR